MRISDHYRPFEEKTIIAVTNNERARLLSAIDREVEELEVIETPDMEKRERITAPFSTTQPDFDAMKQHRLVELYHKLSERLKELTRDDKFTKIVVCVPEVNKNVFIEHLHSDLEKKISEVIPKNLASMEIAHIVRILLEG